MAILKIGTVVEFIKIHSQYTVQNKIWKRQIDKNISITKQFCAETVTHTQPFDDILWTNLYQSKISKK